MNAIDRLVAWFDPMAGLRRRAARGVLAAYEAAQPSRQRKFRLADRSFNQVVQRDAPSLRAQIRWLEQNHDLARGALRVLVNNTIGPTGIGIEPQPRRGDGSIDNDYAKKLREAWVDWQRRPEVTARMTWSRAQRVMARTWFRDGEAFAQHVTGPVPTLDHGTLVPYSLELLEADMVPIDHNDANKGIRHGVERNAWGRPRAYWVYKTDPADGYRSAGTTDLKRVPADSMMHVAAVDRIGQIRGVSEFASVILRLDDIKDYEESERIAAKIAARLTAYIRKGSPELYNPDDQRFERDASGAPLPRDLRLEAGTIIDGLGAGEEIGTIDSKRPNPNLVTFRQGQLRAAAAGLGTTYSSLSRDYNGTYSAQRQELVEQWVHYATLTDEFTGMCVRPVWETFVEVAALSGVVPRPRDVPAQLADDALFVGQSMPWIDPMKEASAWKELVRAGFASEVEVMRKRGVNPRDVLAQIAQFRREAREAGLVFASDAANDSTGPASPQATPEPIDPPPAE